MHEVVVLALVSFAGGLSDRVGRRPLYAIGTLVAGANLAAFVLAAVGWLRSGRPVRFDPAEARSSSTMGPALH